MAKRFRRRASTGTANSSWTQVQLARQRRTDGDPTRIIAVWRDFFGEHYGGGPRRAGIGEPIWAGRSAAELDECRRHESLLNLAFADAPAWSLFCPYNTTDLDDEVLVAAEHNHPVLAGRSRSAEFAADGRQAFAGKLPRLAGHAEESAFGPGELHRVRHLVHDRGAQAGLEEQQVADFVLAANEIATNSLRYGGGRGTVEIARAGNALICDFRDSGKIEDPLVGRRRPPIAQVGGRGLWLANQLCDLVQVRSNDACAARFRRQPLRPLRGDQSRNQQRSRSVSRR